MQQFSRSMMAVVVLSLILTGQVLGQKDYLFENITVNEGLSNDEIYYFLQDAHGLMWISTLNGLNRYDGYNIRIFKNDPSDSVSIPSDIVDAMAEDSEGGLWISCYGNIIARYDPRDDSFRRYPIEQRGITNLSDFTSALKDTKGNIWFASTNHGIQRLRPPEERFHYIPLDSTNSTSRWGEAYDICELKNGNIITSDYSNGIKIYNEKLNTFQPFFIRANYSPNEIVTIYEDMAGNIWFGGRDKLIKFSPTYYTSQEYDIFSTLQAPTNYDVVTGIVEDNENNLWVSVYSQGLFRIDYKSDEIRRYDIGNIIRDSSGRLVIQSIYKDRYGIIWIGTIGSGVVKFDPLREPFNFYKLQTENHNGTGYNIVTGIAGLPDMSTLVIGSRKEGLYRFDMVTKQSARIALKLPEGPAEDGTINIRALTTDMDGRIWFVYNNYGLHRLEKDGKINSFSSPFRGCTVGYSAEMMTADLMGNLWIASSFGIEKFNPQINKFSLLPTITNKDFEPELREKVRYITNSRHPLAKIIRVGEAANLEENFTLSAQTKLLILCLGEGRIQGGNQAIFDMGSLRDRSGKLLWAMNNMSRTFNDGGGFKNRIALACMDLDKGDYKIEYISDVGHSYGTWNVFAPPDSDWWGIQVYPLSETEYASIKKLNEASIGRKGFMPMEIGNYVEVSKRYHNILWIGSQQNGFFQYDLSSGEYKQYNYDPKNQFSANNTIKYILEDREGFVWIASANRLLRFNPEKESFEKFDQSDGLASNVINALIEDLEGNLWISTSGGISKLNKYAPRDKWNFVNFDTRDGLVGYSSSPACWRNPDGELIIGGNDGINAFFPGKINPTPPDIVIQDIKVSDISVKSDSSGVSLQTGVPDLETLDLPYFMNDLSFDFATIHFSRPEKNKVSYMLEGFNDHWIDTDRNFASYTNLDPGTYVFRVKGASGDGIWDSEGRSVRITINPPWWMTTWAYFGYLLMFAGIVFLIDRVQRRRVIIRERSNAAIKEAELRAQLAEAESERKTKELEEARSLQLSMLPQEIPRMPHIDIAVYMKTATEVGGDYYDFHLDLDGTLTVVIGDATGHGMKAGTMVTTAKSLFSSYAPNPDILFSFQEITRCIKHMNLGKLSMCMTMLKIRGNKLTMSAAGMPPVFIFRRKDRVVEEHLIKGMPLGTMDKFPYELKETTLNPGDTIMLLSDGLPELQNAENEMFGYKRVRNRFEEIAEREPEDVVGSMKDAGSAWVDNAEPGDDVTFVILKIKS